MPLTSVQRRNADILHSQGDSPEQIAHHLGVDPADLTEQPDTPAKPNRRGRGKARAEVSAEPTGKEQ